jgi:hypothetical protein
MLCPLVDWQLESLYFYIHETWLHVLHRHCIGYFTYIWNQEKKRICQQIFIDINDGFTFIFNMSGWITVHYKYNASPKEEPHWLIIKRTKSFKKKMKATNCIKCIWTVSTVVSEKDEAVGFGWWGSAGAQQYWPIYIFFDFFFYYYILAGKVLHNCVSLCVYARV